MLEDHCIEEMPMKASVAFVILCVFPAQGLQTPHTFQCIVLCVLQQSAGSSVILIIYSPFQRCLVCIFLLTARGMVVVSCLPVSASS